MEFGLHEIDSCADHLRDSATALQGSDIEAAKVALAPISGQVWMGTTRSMRGAQRLGGRNESRHVPDRLRAEVFMRDGFQCTRCGGRCVPRSILVAFHDVFPDAIPYNANYKHGLTHPAFWWLAPEADHFVPHSVGGANALENLTTLHAVCNTMKSDSESVRNPTHSIYKEWDGLVSCYEALIAAGAGTARPDYHRKWRSFFRTSN